MRTGPNHSAYPIRRSPLLPKYGSICSGFHYLEIRSSSSLLVLLMLQSVHIGRPGIFRLLRRDRASSGPVASGVVVMSDSAAPVASSLGARQPKEHCSRLAKVKSECHRRVDFPNGGADSAPCPGRRARRSHFSSEGFIPRSIEAVVEDLQQGSLKPKFARSRRHCSVAGVGC